MIEVIDNFATLEVREKIMHSLKDSGFGMFHYKDSVKGDGKAFMSHVLLVRPEDRETDKNDRGVRSKYFFDLMAGLVEYHKKSEMNLGVQILRAAVNMTYNNGHREGNWHKDHDYPHKHMIIYLNTPEDKTAVTEIKQDDGEIMRVEPKKWRAVIMDDHEHRAIYPEKGDRWVLVITYTEELLDQDNG